MLGKLEIVELDLEVQKCNQDNCFFDCKTPVPGTCTAKWTEML